MCREREREIVTMHLRSSTPGATCPRVQVGQKCSLASRPRVAGTHGSVRPRSFHATILRARISQGNPLVLVDFSFSLSSARSAPSRIRKVSDLSAEGGSALYYISCYIVLYCFVLFCCVLYYLTLPYLTLHYITLHYFTLHYITLQDIVVYYIISFYIIACYTIS